MDTNVVRSAWRRHLAQGWRRRLVIGIFAGLIAVTGVAVACGTGGTSFRLDAANSSGADPFSPSFASSQARLRSPANVSGSFAGNTPGLYGGTMKKASCDQRAMIAFLAANPDKAAAWADVVGIDVNEVAVFIGGLTPVLLRADTFVTNHGFVDGKATVVPAVLQAGTAVLVTPLGVPVTKCFCGNPLTAPPSQRKANFAGTRWPGFAPASIIVVQAASVAINQFILVQPNGTAFARPAATTGADDITVVTTPPLFGAAPPSAAPSARATASAAGSSAATPSGTASAPASGTPPGGQAPPSANASSATSGGPSAAGSPTTSPPPSASWVVGNCFVDHGTGQLTMRATVRVRNNTTATHTYYVTVAFGPPNARYGLANGSVDDVGADQIDQEDVRTIDVAPEGRSLPDGPVECEIESIEDEAGVTPEQGQPIDPPRDVQPSGTPQTPSTSPS